MKKAPSELSPSGKKKTEIVHVYVLLFANKKHEGS